MKVLQTFALPLGDVAIHLPSIPIVWLSWQGESGELGEMTTLYRFYLGCRDFGLDIKVIHRPFAFVI